MKKELFMEVYGDALLKETCQLTPHIHAINESDPSYPKDGFLFYLEEQNTLYFLDTPCRDKLEVEKVKGLLKKEWKLVGDWDEGAKDDRRIAEGIYAYIIACEEWSKGTFLADEQFYEFYNQLQHGEGRERRTEDGWVLMCEAEKVVQYEESLEKWRKIITPNRQKKVQELAAGYFQYMIRKVIAQKIESEECTIRIGNRKLKKGISQVFCLDLMGNTEPTEEHPIVFKGVIESILQELFVTEFKSEPYVWGWLSYYMKPIDEGAIELCGDMMLERDVHEIFKEYVKKQEKIWEVEHNKGMEREIGSLVVLHQRLYETEIQNLGVLANMADVLGEYIYQSMRSYLQNFLNYMLCHYGVNRKPVRHFRPQYTWWRAEMQVVLGARLIIPKEMHAESFDRLLEQLVEDGYLEQKYGSLHWRQSAPLYGVFVDEVSTFLNLRPSNGRIPWSLFLKIIGNGRKLYDAAQKGLQRRECIRGYEKLHNVIVAFLQQDTTEV